MKFIRPEKGWFWMAREGGTISDNRSRIFGNAAAGRTLLSHAAIASTGRQNLLLCHGSAPRGVLGRLWQLAWSRTELERNERCQLELP